MHLPFSTDSLQTPCYVTDVAALKRNGEILKSVQQETGCKILLAQKAFSMFATYPILKPYLAGTTASGLYEAKLGREEMGGEVHIFSPAYPERDFPEICAISDHIVFNSFHQWQLHMAFVQSCGRPISFARLTARHRKNADCASTNATMMPTSTNRIGAFTLKSITPHLFFCFIALKRFFNFNTLFKK